MSEQAFSLFGYPSPEEVRTSIGRADMQDDMTRAQMPPGSMSRLAMNRAGRLFGKAGQELLGVQDPRVVKAEKMKMAQQRVQQMAKQSGINFAANPDKYVELAATVLADMGEHDLALKAIEARDTMLANQATVAKDYASAELDTARAQGELAITGAKIDEIYGKLDYNKKKLVIEAMKASAYQSIASAQASGSQWKAKQSEEFMRLTKKLEAGTITPNEKEALNYYGKQFMPGLDQVVGSMLGGAGGVRPTPPAGIDEVDAVGGSGEVVDIDGY